MTVVFMDGNVRVSVLTACANTTAPTVAELNAGTDITGYITPDGLDISTDTGQVDVGNVGSTYGLFRAGRRTVNATLTMHHDATSGSTDPAWNLLIYRFTGFLAVRTGVLKTTAWATGQGAGGTTGSVMVLPIECGEFNPVKPAPDTSWDFSVPLRVYLDPQTLRSVVA